MVSCAIDGLGRVKFLRNDLGTCPQCTSTRPLFLGTEIGVGNINTDPQFVSLFTGDLRIGSDSPCVDRGATLIDSAPFTAGFQPLPLCDLAGNLRVGDGNADVDMGAYEAQGGE